jgi:protocatechuate 3,4-dioxygenase beta subunit
MRKPPGMRLLSRRESIALLGLSGVSAWAHGANAKSTASGGQQRCIVRPQQTEGPYYVDSRLNRSDIRVDPVNEQARPGVPLQVTFRVSSLSGESACVPLAGAMVDVWHCDASGIYSDVADAAYDTSGQKFLRGYQITDAAGAARFQTIYPGWYPGRSVHIHYKVRAGQQEFTSQIYFDESLTERVLAQPAYSRNVTHRQASERRRNEDDWIYRRGGTQLLLPLKAADDGYEGTLDLALRV